MSQPAPLTARLDEWLARRRPRVLGVLVLCAVFVRLLVWLQVGGGPLVRIHEIHPATDSHFFSQWADHLAQRDWLQREPLHPMSPWMVKSAEQVMREHPDLPVRLGLASDASYDKRAMAPALWMHWLGGAAYFQEPLYPYLVALTRLVAGGDTRAVFAWQLMLGVLGTVLVYQLGRRLFGETAGVAAAVLGLAYPALVVHELALLRDSLITFLTLALLVALFSALERGGSWRWALFGFVAGVSVLVKVPFIIFLGLAVVGARVSRRCTFRDAGLVVLCAVLGMLPALVRNAVVGVPLFRLNGSGTAMLALFHIQGALPYQFSTGPLFAEVLARTDARFLPSLLEAIRTHASVLDFLQLCLAKLAYTWHGAEVPNNVDLALFLHESGLLRALPVSFWALAVLGAVGLVATRAQWRRLWPLYVGLAACLPTLLLASVLSRYRLPLAAVLLPLAGAGVVALAGQVAARRWRALAVTTALAVPYAVWATRPLPAMGGAGYYQRLGSAWLGNGQPAYALLHFQEALRLEPESAAARLGLGRALVREGRLEEALAELEDAGRRMDSGAPHLERGRALLAAGRREEGRAALREAVSREPQGSQVRQQSEQLLSASGER